MGKQKEDIQSPDTVLQDLSSNSKSNTLSSKESTLDLLTLQDPKPAASKWLSLLQLLKSKSKRQLLTLHPARILNQSRRFSSSMREGFSIRPNAIIDDGFNNSKPKWKNFTLSELQTATKNFNNDNLIGKGGFAEVYKGCLEDGRLVAVKQLVRGQPEERIGEFLSELGNMAHINHPNTARLIGYGMEGGFYLVLELSPNGSLASLLQSSKEKLTWNIRYKIALGTARGLSYLHEGYQRRIIHRDIKAANILLTEDFEPQICDFGLAKWLPEQWTHLTVSKCDGTFGYLAPELLLHGIVDEKTDVFAFGVLLLELITGRRALNFSQQSLLMWARPLLRKNIITELVDPSLNDYCPLEMNLMILAACLCVQESSFQRPQMNQVLLLLRGSCGSMELVKSRKLSYWEWHYEELFNGEGHENKTTCLNDVNPKNSCPHEMGWCLQI